MTPGTGLGQTGPATALNQIRVVEIEGSVAGGYAAMLLADQGVGVTKVIGVGQPSLGWTPAMRHYLERSSTVVDPSDDAQLDALLAGADVVIESSSPDPLRSVLPGRPPSDGRRIEVEISPLGPDGPLAGHRSTDLTDQARSGHLLLNGDPDREPLQGPEHQVAYAAGTHCAIGVLAALRARTVTGRGQRMVISHQRVMAALHQFTLLRQTHNGDILRRMGNRYAGPGNPVGIYRCGDGLLTLITPRGDQLEALLAVTGLEHLVDEPGIGDIYELMHHPTLLDDHLGPWLAAQNRDETIELFQAMRIPAAAVATLDGVLADEHLAARQAWVIQDIDGDEVRAPGSPVRLTTWPDVDPTEADAIGVETGLDLGDGPLAGVRVLDLTRVWAGPLATRILADLGADVVMVEAPWARGGPTIDDVSVRATRYYPDNDPGPRHWNRIGFANKYNINKRNIAIDLSHPDGVGLLEALIAEADILVENYSPRVMPNFGLDDERLHQLNPGLIVVTMPGFGRSGPSRDHVAYGPIVDSQAGLSALMGYRGETARKAGVAWPDPVAGTHAAFAALTALHQRSADGAGRTAEVAQIEATVAMAGHALIEHQIGSSPAPEGNRNRAFAPQGVYRCTGDDRWVAISVVDDAGWEALVEAAGLDRSWAAWTVDQRHDNHDAIDEMLAGWTITHDQDELVAALGSTPLAVAPVADAAQVMADPQLAAQEAFVELDHPEAGRHRWPRLPIELSDTPATYRRPGPTLNQHGAEILTTIVGRSEAEVAALYEAGVIADRPPA